VHDARVERANASFAALGVFVLTACTRAPDAPEPRADPAPAPIPSAIVSAPPPSELPVPREPIDLHGVAAWTDPKAIAALAQDCHAAPAGGEMGTRDPLSCRLAVDQSCVPDLCFDEQERACRPACQKQCDDCSGTCSSSCDTCKTRCRDDACRTACASACGACRQACLTTLDDCATGACGKARAECDVRVAAEWKAGRCASVCPRVSACIVACGRPNAPDDCAEKCRSPKLMGKCPEKFAGYCLFGVTP
jgi:hypothetical protein